MFKTFNCGIGLVLVISLEDVESIQSSLSEKSLKSDPIGHVVDYHLDKSVGIFKLYYTFVF